MVPETDFAGPYNFGVALGYTFRRSKFNKWAVSVVSGYSIANVNIDTQAVTSNKTELIATNGYSAFSLSIGGLITYDSKFQAGIFLGTDYISNLNYTHFGWKYQGQPWISIGLGLSIFALKDEAEAAKNNVAQKPKK